MKQKQHLNGYGNRVTKKLLQAEFLRESKLLSLLPVGAYICDGSGAILYHNEKAAQLWGKTPKLREASEQFFSTFRFYSVDGIPLPHDRTPFVACLIDDVSRENVQIIMERSDRSRINVSLSAAPMKDEAGNTIGSINCIYEIGRPQQSENELHSKLKQLQDYVDNAAIGLHWVERNGIIKWANTAELRMLGYTREEYIGHHIAEFHADQGKINDILHRLSCDETLNCYESELRCKDGSTKTVQITSNVFWDEDEFIHTRCFTIDVSEQKKLLQALKVSEQRYKTLVDSLPTAVYTCDLEGRITFFNELAVALWGYTPDITNDSLRFCACHKVWLPDGTFVAPHETPMAIALQTGQSFRNVEALVERPDGSKFYTCVNIEPIFDEAGTRIGAINILQDITTLKETEIALRASEHRYKNLVDSLEMPLYTTDAEGRVTLYNKAAADLWGREPEIGKDLWCGSYKILNVDGTNLPLEECPMAVCLKERRPVRDQEILVVRPDGTMRHVAPHPQPILDASGKMLGAINMLVDVTEVKRTERALRESEAGYRTLAASLEKKVQEKTIDLERKHGELKKSEERYHKMIEEVEDYAIILLDRQGTVLNWNKGAEKIKGYREEEIVGKNFSNFYLPDDRSDGLPQKLLRRAAEEGKAVHEGWRIRKDGSFFWGSIVLTALHGQDNSILGFSKVTRDLTERKLAEDKLHEYTRQLEFQNKELEQFAYAASHDMKAPLRKIHLFTTAIAENPANSLDEQSSEFLSRAISAVKRMDNLIENLLTYAKTTANDGNFVVVDLNEVLATIRLIHKEEFSQSDVTIENDQLPILRAVPFQMEQLLFNLIHNSIKYKHPERNACIRINAAVVRGSAIPRADTQPHREYHQVSVIDNGVGFDPQYAEKIFNIFQRLDNLPSTSGSGIGLAICKRIVQNHHGFIRAKGEVNAGTVIDIYLPKDL